MHHFQPRARDELREREVRAGAVARGCVVVLARTRLHLVDEFAQRAGVDDLRIDGEHVGDVDERRDRREIRFHIEGQLAVERGIDAVRRRRAEQKRVAVGLRLRHRLRSEVAARADAVVNDELRA